MHQLSRSLLVAVFSFLTAGCGPMALDAGPVTAPKRAPRLHAGGSSFVNPLMQRWCADYFKDKQIKVQYQSIGSGAGIQHMTARTFDFGATDAPMSEEQLGRARDVNGEVIHIPLAMGAVVLAYNLPGIEQPLRFTPHTLSEIYQGAIKQWNDPRLQVDNPDITLPNQEILVVHRSDSSGTTFVWTDYLTKVSPDWAKKVGTGTSVKWPCGTGQKGNEGVSAYVAATPGAIGYTELTYGLQKKLKMGLVQNREGVFIRPTLESVTAAAAGALDDIPADLRYSLNNIKSKEAYPICGTVWAVLYLEQSGDKGQATVDFLRWATHDGQKLCEELHYASLPVGLVSRVDEKIGQIKVRR